MRKDKGAVATAVRPQDYVVPKVAIDLIPCEHAVRHRVCPIAVTESANGLRVVELACADPYNLPMLDQIQKVAGCRIKPVKANEQDVLAGIVTHYRDVASTAIADILPQLEQAMAAQEVSVATAATDGTGDTPTVRSVLDRIFRRAVGERATDIHIEPHDNQVLVRFRVDGMLIDHMGFELNLHAPVISRIKILSNLDISQFRLPQDGRLDVQVGKQVYDVRVSTVPTVSGESVVMRLLPKGALALSFDELGLTDTCKAELNRMVHQPYGMVILSGPTGSGKTTTLYAGLTTLDCVGRKVFTVEDPVEYQFHRVVQMQVNPKIGLTFAAGLRAILRQDPDVIMVGEVRDLETLDMAIHSSLTGHLVLTTLHCNDVAAAPSRMVDMGAEPFLVASAVTGLVSQRLLRRICPDCKAPTHVSDTVRRKFGLPQDGTVFYHGKGCDRCRGTGYYGRVSVFEVVPLREEIQQAVIRNASATEIRHIIRNLGYPSLADDGLSKAVQGITTIEEVLRAVYAES